VPPDLELTRCRYAVQLKSWYDEQYNDWAKRYLRERLYNPHGEDRGAGYMYRNLLAQQATKRKVVPTRVTGDEEYLVTECKQIMHFCACDDFSESTDML